MRKSIKGVVLAVVLALLAGGLAGGCSSDIEDELERLNRSNCSPKTSDWPGCLEQDPGDDDEFSGGMGD